MIRFQKTVVPFKPSCTLVQLISVARVRHLSWKSLHKVACDSKESRCEDASPLPPAIEILNEVSLLSQHDDAIHLLLLAKLAPRRCQCSEKTLLLLGYSTTKNLFFLWSCNVTKDFLASDWQTCYAEHSLLEHQKTKYSSYGPAM